MPTLTIDGKEVTVENGATILQACEEAGVEVPRFCYHNRLSVAGNCRMCLVQMEKAPKPVASCAMPAGDGMVIHTNTPEVEKARNGVMEFLLINHPLDCPICDQGGECDLQDQAMAYGCDQSRYHENKRAVKEKYMGPLIKTIMTRCIHCTRCIRFMTEIAGTETLGAVFRGEDMEISTFIESAIGSELSGNIADVCPVGALTHKPTAFAARPWELRKTESIDVQDAVGSNIRVDTRGAEVIRVLPRLHEDINEEWISDRTRHAVDGLRQQRLDQPYRKVDGRLQPCSWDQAFEVIAEKISASEGPRLAAIAGDMIDSEAMFALKELMTSLGSANIDCRQDGAKLSGAARGDYIFNTSIAGIEEADALLIIGANPRWEASLVNARIRKRWLSGELQIGVVGEALDLTYKYQHLGAGPESLKQISDGSHDFATVLKNAERPMLILGPGALAREDGQGVYATARKIAADTGMISADWNGFNVLHTAASRVAGLDMGFLPGENGLDLDAILDGAEAGDLDLVWLLGADEIDTAALAASFVVYQGHHGDRGAAVADVILPGAAYTEKDGLWVNTEGRVQLGRRAGFPPGEAKEDWAIIRAFSTRVGAALSYDNLSQLRDKLRADYPSFDTVDEVAPGAMSAASAAAEMNAEPFISPVSDFYLANAVCRASEVMAECSRTFIHGTAVGGATGTNG